MTGMFMISMLYILSNTYIQFEDQPVLAIQATVYRFCCDLFGLQIFEIYSCSGWKEVMVGGVRCKD